MKPDLYRLAGILVPCLIAGLITGQVAVWLLLGLLVCVILYARVLYRLYLWLQHPGNGEPPELPGMLESMRREIDGLRKQSRQRRHDLNSYLKRFRDAAEALPDAIVVLGEQDEIDWANGRSLEYLGIRQVEDRGQRIVNLIRHPDIVNFFRACRDLSEGGQRSLEVVSPVSTEIHLELRLVSYGRSEKLLVARDVTKIHRINRMRSDFIANASHELRTPLTVIAGYLESFEDEFSADEHGQILPRIRQMRSQAERMRRLIEDLLKLSSLETNENPGQQETVRVPDLLGGIIEEARSLSNGAHDFRQEIDPTLWLRGDRNQIQSALSNVIFNAVQHTTGPGTITVRWYRDGKGAGIFETIDTGEGIAAEHLPRLTERFYRVDRGRTRNKGGTGLGLAIVKHILARHGSKLEIESRQGKGSTFRFRFPASLVIQRDIIPDSNQG